MSNEDNKAIVRRWYEEFWNRGKLEVADELLHTDYVYQDGYGAGAPSVMAIKEGHAIWHRILPDMHFTIEDMIAEGETVVVRWTRPVPCRHSASAWPPRYSPAWPARACCRRRLRSTLVPAFVLHRAGR